MKPIKANYLAAAAKALAWQNTARGAGRIADADLLALMAAACRDCSEYAPESEGSSLSYRPPSSDLRLPPSEETAVCCLCEGIGTKGPSGYTCQNRRCPRFGVPLPKVTFEGPQETRQDRAGEAADSGGTSGRPEACG